MKDLARPRMLRSLASVVVHPYRAIEELRTNRHLNRYATALTTLECPSLAAVAQTTRTSTHTPYMMIDRVVGQLLTTLVHIMQPKLVLEIGTFTGYGTLAMASALPAGGRIITCEIDDRTAQLAQGHFDSSPHGDRIDLQVGDALDVIGRLPGPFDMVFVDAEKSCYLDYYEAVLCKLAPNGLIVVDNTLHEGLRVTTGDPTRAIQHVKFFNAVVAEDPSVRQVVLNVRDGVTLIRRVPVSA